MLEKIKKYLRITDTDFNEEVTDLILACKADLELSGITNISDVDPLIIRAVATYCKAHFGFDNPDRENLLKSYDLLKSHLGVSEDYKEV